MNQTDYNFERFYGKWVFIQAIINILGLLLTIASGNHMLWFVAIICSFSIFIFKIPRYSNLPNQFGYANAVTALRLLLIIVLGFLHEFLTSSVLFIGFLLAIILDGVDGYIARKYNQSSKAGETLDMETDAFMVLLLSWIHYNNGTLAYWILIPGGLRYYYEIAFNFFPSREVKLPTKKIRATIAVAFFVALLLPFIFQNPYSNFFIISASILICISFLVSIIDRFFLTSQSAKT